jgi:tRNA (Thr-GGU) A37 N-methylase
LYWLHRAPRARLRVRPFLQDVTHGVFATRHPARPNPLGLSLVRLVRREGGMLHFLGADMLDGTPLLDIKPYARRYDAVAKPRGGWTEEVDEVTARRRGRRQRVATEAATLPAEAAGGRRRPRRQSES